MRWRDSWGGGEGGINSRPVSGFPVQRSLPRAGGLLLADWKKVRKRCHNIGKQALFDTQCLQSHLNKCVFVKKSEVTLNYVQCLRGQLIVSSLKL
jgi:hypothetical protein